MALRDAKFMKTADVVITGISGVFPKSANVEEFKENLLAGNDMTSEHQRWDTTGEQSRKMGVLEDLDRFDYSYFRITKKQAEAMTISSRIILEKVFEAVLDAGYNPKHLEGTNTGVFVGLCNNENEVAHNMNEINEYAMLSHFRGIAANRISYCLNVRGPSVVVDTACSTGLYAVDSAYRAIQNGSCDAAIVCTSNLCLSPFASYALHYAGVLSPNGMTSTFDADADGYVRADAIVAVVLQKREHARRIYAHVVHAKTNCNGFSDEGILYPSKDLQADLFRQFYKEIDIDPGHVSYIEAHGTGTKVGDNVEVSAVEEVFCQNRRAAPLKIGSVKSNMGHGEFSSGLCSLTKLIIAFETGVIPANIHFKTPHPNIKAFHNGNMRVIAEPTPCDGKYYGINNFGAGGANAHLLLSPHNKLKVSSDSTDESIPRLVPASGRTQEAVDVILKNVVVNGEDVEYIRLLHEIFGDDINGHGYRGYVLVNRQNVVEKEIKFFSGDRRPIWFVFSGMGSQWPTMGRSLMNIPIFAESIRKSHEILRSKGVNLMEIISNDDPTIFTNILNSFVGIPAIQIALVDVLNAVHLRPDGIIGHSVGELGCAYADGCFTATQTLLSAYYRGLVSLETEFIHGTMAAVDVGYEVLKDLVPDEIDIAARNGPTSTTISGPTDVVKLFVEELKKQNITVHNVNTSNIPYHSRYIASAGPALISYVTKIVPHPKPRSKKWICTAAPEAEWNTDLAKYSSSEYFANNLLNPVYFEEGLRHIPDNAITVEIAPHGLLQPILKRSLASSVDNIALTLRNNDDGVRFMLNALGSIYIAGGNPKLSNLYPPVAFPVSKGTPMISPLIRWQHDEKWPVTKYANMDASSGERDIFLDLTSNRYEYLNGHIIDDRTLLPAMGYLHLVWETVAAMVNKNCHETSIVFENIRFERATHIQDKQKLLNFHVSIRMGTGSFEVSENNEVVATGLVRVPEDINLEKIKVTPPQRVSADSDILPLKNQDFYKALRLKGYQYKGLFKKVQHVNHQATYAEVSWCNNFVSFMDTMAQITIQHRDVDELMVPTSIRKFVIDVGEHFKILNTLDAENPEFSVNFYPHFGLLSSGGIQITDINSTPINRKRNRAQPVLEKYQFVPYISDQKMDLNLAIRLCVQIALENSLKVKVKTLELPDRNDDNGTTLISTLLVEVLKDLPTIQADVNVLNDGNLEQTFDFENLPDVKILDEIPSDNSNAILVAKNIISNTTNRLCEIFGALDSDGFVITREPITANVLPEDLGLDICFNRIVDSDQRILLLRKRTAENVIPVAVKIENSSYSWIPTIQKNLLSLQPNDKKKLIVYAEGEPQSGILGFFNCLRKEERGANTRCFFLIDRDSPKFSLETSFYKTQLKKNLSHNIYQDGHWGSYCYVPLEPAQDIDVPHTYNTQLVRGDLSTLRWVEGSLDPNNNYPRQTRLIYVYYSALNFKSVLLGAGKISSEEIGNDDRSREGEIGIEFCGKDETGDRYIGMVSRKGLSNIVEAVPDRTWRVPDNMSLEEASTVAVVYATVIYAFFFKINLQNGCSVLIHSGSGGIGQAAIIICLQYGCDIFTTVSTPEKVRYIRKRYPQIPENHIGNSTDLSFEKMIMEQTKGKGVDVVLNSLSGEKLRASLRCVTDGGDFLEIGKFDMLQNGLLELRPFKKSITFHSIQMDNSNAMKPCTRIALQKKVQHMLDMGIIKPIDRTVFSMGEVESAIRYMAAKKHVGKVVIKIRDEEDDVRAKPLPIFFKARARFICEEVKSYLIVGGLGGLGLELTEWLISRGAKKIVLNSRSNIKNGYQSYKIEKWRSNGVNVVVNTDDVTTETGAQNLLEMANSLGALSAIFNVAMILKDDPFSQQTEETFRICAAPKGIATIHLDKLSRRMCPRLKHFVVFSSVISGRGNRDSSNYGMSNSIMERVCETRRANNLPALAIQWGAIGEVGAVANFAENSSSSVVIRGTLQQQVASCMETLDVFTRQSDPIVSSIVVAEKRNNDKNIIDVVANILGITDLESISQTRTLPELGMDSIMSAELKQIVELEFRIFLTSSDMKNLTFGKLYNMKENKETLFNLDESASTTPIQELFNDKFVNLPIIRIPFNGSEPSEEISAQDNPTVFVFPGVEGMAKIMESLGKNLTSQVLCFQYFSENLPQPDFQAFANYFAQLISNRLGANQEFRIIGHSLGTSFALEVANILEKQGRKGYVWMIDGSPAYLREATNTILNRRELANDYSIESFICLHILRILVPQFVYEDDLFKPLNDAKSWEEMKKFCCSAVPERLFDEKLIHRLLDSALHFSKKFSASEFNVESLQTRCTLIKCADNPYNLNEDYGLSEYFRHPIRIHKIENVNHSTILSNEKTADIINNSDPLK